MCITFFVLNPLSAHKSDVEFLIAFNRDEQSHRKTIPFGSFEDDPNIYAGEDLISKGTWLGINIKTGILAFLTNFDQKNPRQGKSRGRMIKNFLKTSFLQKTMTEEEADEQIIKEMQKILKDPMAYSAFNLVVYHISNRKIYYICTENGMKEPQILKQGVSYGLCNGSLDDIWPKTQYGLTLFRPVIQNLQEKDTKRIFEQLQQITEDTKSFSEDPEDESSIFITPYYSQIEKAERKTKSTFFGLIRREQDQRTIDIREITYNQQQQREIIDLQFKF